MATKKILVNSLIGRIYGKWEVIDSAPSKNGKAFWTCRCTNCGLEKVISESSLYKMRKITCNCKDATESSADSVETLTETEKKTISTTATKTKSKKVLKVKTIEPDLRSKLLRVWLNLTRKCSANDLTGKYYARGISLCNDWRFFDSFARWAVESGFTGEQKLARKSVFKDFTPSNCYWK